MEAGHQMHTFSCDLFSQMDKGKSVANLYMINGKLHESLLQSFSGLSKPSESQQVAKTLIERMRVVFRTDE